MTDDTRPAVPMVETCSTVDAEEMVLRLNARVEHLTKQLAGVVLQKNELEARAYLLRQMLMDAWKELGIDVELDDLDFAALDRLRRFLKGG